MTVCAFTSHICITRNKGEGGRKQERRKGMEMDTLCVDAMWSTERSEQQTVAEEEIV